MMKLIKKLFNRKETPKKPNHDAAYFFMTAPAAEKSRILREAARRANADQLKLYNEMTSGKTAN